ncbi:MAG: YeeE/YedE family protein [Xanthobacteraceae bacterium]|nr:YeeE/YedE family protein [Xanthobacteraceae bacterium]
MWIIAPLSCGLIFGAGLLISGMVQPTKVLGFLDIFGAWDPSLAVVMAAALAVAVPGFRLAGLRTGPLLARDYFWPTRTGIDAPLVIGAALFGIGWGLVGLCPGPALESLATLSPGVIVFVVAMAAGMALHSVWQKSRPAMRRDNPLASATDG